jgi:hypothetical protein
MKPASVPSGRSWAIFAVLVGIVVVAAVLFTKQVGGESGATAAADIGTALSISLSAAAILWASRRLDWNAFGRPWLLIGLGTASYALGDITWAIIEVGQHHEVPYPGLPDLFYLLQYPLCAAGIVMAGLAFRKLVPLTMPVILAAITGVASSALVYIGLIAPTVLVADQSTAEKVLSAAYPLADCLLLLAPAVFVLATVARLGGGKLAWPWWGVAVGALVIAGSDVAYSWMSAMNLYQSGAWVDYGWGVGHALIALGALVALDLSRKQT